MSAGTMSSVGGGPGSGYHQGHHHHHHHHHQTDDAQSSRSGDTPGPHGHSNLNSYPNCDHNSDGGMSHVCQSSLCHNVGKVNRIYVPLPPSSILVLAYGRWCSMAGTITVGLVGSNGSLLPGNDLSPMHGLTVQRPRSAASPYAWFTSMKLPYVEELPDIMSIYTRLICLTNCSTNWF